MEMKIEMKNKIQNIKKNKAKKNVTYGYNGKKILK